MANLELKIKQKQKERALALRDKMFDTMFILRDGYNRNECEEVAKECALIAINEMLDFRNDLYINENSLVHKHLLEIKKEIELL